MRYRGICIYESTRSGWGYYIKGEKFMVYETEDAMYGYKVVFVCKWNKRRGLCPLLRIPGSPNIIYAVIKIEIPKGTTIVDPIEQENNGDLDYHKLRCEDAKFVEVVKYCYIRFEEKINKSESKIYSTINEYLVELSEKEVINYNKSKDIEYCSIHTYSTHFSDDLIDSDILKLNDFMVAYPFLNTNDNLVCAPGIHFFKTEKEAYNYLVCLHSYR